jgi:hypothetical protein
MRLIVQPMAGRFELCARLGLVLAPAMNLKQVIHFGMVGQFEVTAPLGGLQDGKLVHAALEDSPSTRAGVQSRDIILAINGKSWHEVRLLTFNDHRPTDITAHQFAVMDVLIRVPPHPHRPLTDIQKEAADIIAARPALDATPYRNPRDDPDPRMISLWESIRPRLQRRNR